MLWGAVGSWFGEILCGNFIGKKRENMGKWFINVYFILHIIIMVILYIAYNYKGIS